MASNNPSPLRLSDAPEGRGVIAHSEVRRGRTSYGLAEHRLRKPRQGRIWLIRAHQAADEHRIQDTIEAWGYRTGRPRRFAVSST